MKNDILIKIKKLEDYPIATRTYIKCKVVAVDHRLMNFMRLNDEVIVDRNTDFDSDNFAYIPWSDSKNTELKRTWQFQDDTWSIVDWRVADD